MNMHVVTTFNVLCYLAVRRQTDACNAIPSAMADPHCNKEGASRGSSKKGVCTRILFTIFVNFTHENDKFSNKKGEANPMHPLLDPPLLWTDYNKLDEEKSKPDSF